VAEQHTLTVKVTGDSSQLVAALNRAQAELAQLDRQSNGAIGGMDDLARASTGTGGALSGMGSMLAGIGWAGAIAGAVALGTELYKVGRASQVASNTFEQLQGSADQASASLALMRDATNFTVPDTTLMSISNLYTQMGLATDPTEVARLAEMGSTLGMAMGNSAEEAMRTFSQLLANQSIELLDTFGISSGKVRERIEELQTANKDLARDQAFVTAVLEQGALAMDRLGESTQENVSAISQLTTRFQNFVAEIGQPIVNASEGVAQLGVNFLDAQQAIDDVQKQISQLNLSELNIDGGVFGNRVGAVQDAIQQIADQLTVSGSYTQTLIDLQTQLTKAHGDTAIELENQIVLLEAIIARTEALDRAQVFGGLNMEAGQEMAGLRTLPSMRYAQEQARLEAERTSQYVDSLLSHASGFRDAFASKPIITDADIANLEMIAQNATQTAETMANIIPESSLKQIQSVASEFSKMADSALQASNYIANINLESALGIGLSPTQQLTSDILGRAGIGGRQAEYLTGQRTQLSEMFESSVLPLLQGIETQFGEDEAARVGDLIAQLMKEGIARGFESNPVQLMEFILGNVDYRYDEGQARSVVVQAGDTLSAIAQREGVSVQLLAEINRLEDPNKILAGQELVVEVGARVTRLVSPEEMDQMQLDSLRGFAMPTATGEDGEPMKPLGVEATGIDQTLLTAQELQTTMSEIVPPVITPAKMGLVAGDVAEVGVVEVIDSIGQKLQDISSRIYQVSMTVNLDANIRTGAGFKIIPITMAELANDISESARIFRLAQGGR
jgi:nucleoid-associated protein YgaU